MILRHSITDIDSYHFIYSQVLFGNLGGSIGIILGWAILNVPSMMTNFILTAKELMKERNEQDLTERRTIRIGRKVIHIQI